MRTKSILLLLCLTVVSCYNSENSSEWRLIYHNDSDGHVISGNKDDLLNAVRAGYPIRIGWGLRSRRDSTVTIEHVCDAKFLSIINGNDVFAQIDPIVGQRPVVQDSVGIYFRETDEWVKIAGSNGFTTARMYNYIDQELYGPSQARYRATAWYVKAGKEIPKGPFLWEN